MKHRWILYAAALLIAAAVTPAAVSVARAHRAALGVRYPSSPGGEFLVLPLLVALAYILDQLLQWLRGRP